MNRRRWLIAIPIVVLLAVVVGPWVYINVIRDDPPERLGFDDATTTTEQTSVRAGEDGIAVENTETQR